jgi:DNA-binding PucR family transcriptional regulator
MATVDADLETVAAEKLDAVLATIDPAEFGAEMAVVLLEAIPELARSDDPDMRVGLRASCVSNLTTLFAHVGSGAPPDQVTPPPEAVAWAHDLVHRGVQLPTLLRAYRLGHGMAVARVEASAESVEPEIRWRVLARASHYFFAYIDAVSTSLTDDYERERARWIRGAAAARAELVTAIIERQPVEPRAATEKLRYDVSRRHLAMLLWADPNEVTQAAGSLEAEAATLAAALGGRAVLTVPIGEHALWAWTAGDGVVDTSFAELRLGPGVRGAIGTSAEGLAGMADSHLQARAARRVADLRNARPGTVTGYRGVGLNALITADPNEAIRFAETELGELAAATDAASRLRATVRVFLEENLSPARTARRLGVHPNTVVYRVARAGEILGRDVEERRLQLEVALRLAESLDGLRAAAGRDRASAG